MSQDELRKAFETEYGPKVKVRLIAVSSRQKADELRQKAAANPETFGDLAKEHSEDANSASARGLIPPIRKNLGQEEVEKAAFALKEGEVSSVLQVGNQYLILRCEKHLPETYLSSQHLPQIQAQLHDQIRDQKLRTAATDLFQKLQAESKVVNVYNDAKLREQMPGVVATINGQSISLQQLTDECYQRHAKEVVDGEINRLVLQQELRKRGKTVTDADIDEEIRRAADAYGYLKPDGTPDVDAWLKAVTETDKVSVDLYVRDAVWPSVALKLLVNEKIEVTKEDLEKGFAANYGERVEVLAIVLGNQRKPTPYGRWRATIRRISSSANWPPNTRSSPCREAISAKCPPFAVTAVSPWSKRKHFACSRENCRASLPSATSSSCSSAWAARSRSCRISLPWKGNCGRTSKRRSSAWPWPRSSIDSGRRPRSTTSSPGLPKAARKPLRPPRIARRPCNRNRSRQPTVSCGSAGDEASLLIARVIPLVQAISLPVERTGLRQGLDRGAILRVRVHVLAPAEGLEHEPPRPTGRCRGQAGELELDFLTRPENRQRIVGAGNQFLHAAELAVVTRRNPDVRQRNTLVILKGRPLLGLYNSRHETALAQLGRGESQRRADDFRTRFRPDDRESVPIDLLIRPDAQALVSAGRSLSGTAICRGIPPG